MILLLRTPPKTVLASRLIGWVVASLAVAVALGWLAAEMATYWAPMILFPLALGGVLGAMLVVMMRTCQVHGRWVVYPIAMLAVMIVVVSQHWLAYHESLRTVAENVRLMQKATAQLPGQLQGQIPTPPENFFVFLRDETRRPRVVSLWFSQVTFQGTRTWLLWGFSGSIVLLTTLLILHQGRNRAWCPTCRTWYRTTRRGRLDRTTTEALLATLQTSTPCDENKSDKNSGSCHHASFLMSDCDGRCGETELRLLFVANSTIQTYYLTLDQRHAMEAILEAKTTSQ